MIADKIAEDKDSRPRLCNRKSNYKVVGDVKKENKYKLKFKIKINAQKFSM